MMNDAPYSEVELLAHYLLNVRCVHCSCSALNALGRHVCIGAILDWIWACTEPERHKDPGAEQIFERCYEKQIDWHLS
jgi:hypothetical protein